MRNETRQHSKAHNLFLNPDLASAATPSLTTLPQAEKQLHKQIRKEKRKRFRWRCVWIMLVIGLLLPIWLKQAKPAFAPLFNFIHCDRVIALMGL